MVLPSPEATVETPAAQVQSEAVAASSTPETNKKQTASTLIEFPGVSRASRPQWRKELSERVREIQERRAREGERQAAAATERRAEQTRPNAAPLGLVPPTEAPAVNPIVVAALKRIQRAQQPSMSRTSRGGSAAAAVARVAEEEFEEETLTGTAITTPALQRSETAQTSGAEALPSEKSAEPVREHNLIVVQPQIVPKTEQPASKQQPRRVFAEAVDDGVVSQLEEEATSRLDSDAEAYDDRAPLGKRLASGIIDLVVVAFASSPFAAIIELTNGNWSDMRVIASMSGILLVVMFLYLTASIALAGRSWGMSLFSTRVVDADTGNFPTTWQCVRRALVYMLSLATLGLGMLYALFDAEGRTLHDLLSGTAVVKE
ncbi:MAG TPA: RDD family protein [Pyrinomonadaceae bacterium]|jgi:uncharacterized RDD family membrane protein YckC